MDMKPDLHPRARALLGEPDFGSSPKVGMSFKGAMALFRLEEHRAKWNGVDLRGKFSRQRKRATMRMLTKAKGDPARDPRLAFLTR